MKYVGIAIILSNVIFSPCIITGDNRRPHILFSTADNIIYIIELALVFETNLNANASRKEP